MILFWRLLLHILVLRINNQYSTIAAVAVVVVVAVVVAVVVRCTHQDFERVAQASIPVNAKQLVWVAKEALRMNYKLGPISAPGMYRGKTEIV